MHINSIALVMHLHHDVLTSFIIIIQVIYHTSTFFMSKIIHVYLFRGIVFSFFSTSMKIFERKLFFNLELSGSYAAIRLTYFSRLSSLLLLSGMPVQAKR